MGGQQDTLNLRLHRLLWPGVMTLAMLAVLLGLGTWQVERLHWKQDVLAQIARAEAAPAVPLPAEPEPYAKVRVTGRLRDDLSASYGAEVRDTPTGTQLGTQLIEPLERDGRRCRSWWIGLGAGQAAAPDRAAGGRRDTGRLRPAERHARPVQRHRQSRGAAILHARSAGDRRGARAAAGGAVHPDRDGAAAAGTLS